MKIAFISLMSGQQWGGSETLWSKSALYAIEQGHEVFISIFDWGTLHPKIRQLQEKGAKIHLRMRFSHDIPLGQKVYRYLQNRNPQWQREWKALLEFNPDHILVSQGNTYDITVHHFDLFEKIKKFDYSLICHSHSQFADIPQQNIYPRAQEIFKKAQNVFVVSQRMQQTIERQLCSRFENMHFTWNPLNLKNPAYIPYPIGKEPQMSVVGDWSSQKGQDILFQIISQEKWQQRAFKINLYGKGQGEKYLRDLAQFYHLENKICFCGFVSPVEEIWRKNHILLIPSAGEGLPISLVEAAVSGRTAVVTDVGGNAEIITDGETGFVACAPSVKSFDEALERAWQKMRYWKLMGEKLHNQLMPKLDLKPHISLLNIITA